VGVPETPLPTLARRDALFADLRHPAVTPDARRDGRRSGASGVRATDQEPFVQGPDISPLQRLVLAFYAFFAILFRADVAAAVFRIREARRAGELPAAPETPTPEAPRPPPEASRPAEPPKPIEPAAGAVAVKPAEPARKVDAAKPAPAEPAKAAPPPAAEPMKPAPVTEPAKVAPAIEAAKPAPAKPDPRPALQLLSLLQREGRLVDFIEEDLAGFPDASIGAAARAVHAGCKRAIEEYFRLEPVYKQAEGAQVTVERGFDPSAIRLTGNVVGEPPFKGALRHHGWRAREVKIPPAKDGLDPSLVAPAEVELG
jgi:hypothetical protein